ncbi:hypothetical protein HDU97_002915 [Phlyctochytrium planicorne]|nr:hypothetical protein HDU97_002915 [Phlyctochytrium planicorne]
MAQGVSDTGVCILIASLMCLESLSLAGCTRITDQVADSISTAQCSRTLKTLDFSGCFNFGSDGVKKLLVVCENLEVLDLGFCWRVTDLAFREENGDPIIICCLGLRSLRLGYCYSVTDRAVEVISSTFTQLEFIDLINTEVSDDGKSLLSKKGVTLGNDAAGTHQ